MRSIVVLTMLSTGLMCGQPLVKQSGIVNAASYAGDIAQGSMFLVFGTGLGPDTLVQASSPLTSSLGGVSVGITSAGQFFQAPLIYVSAGQIAALLPSGVPIGPAALSVSYGGKASTPAGFNVVRSSFGAFTNNSRGNGPAVLQNFVSQSEQTRNGLSSSATPGQVVILWGTGLGPITGSDTAVPPPVGDLPSNITVSVSGKIARVLYKGRSGCCAGIDQIVFEVPQDVDGCYLALTVAVDGTTSKQDTTVSVASAGRACTEPGLLTSADLDKARAQGGLRLGTLLLATYSFDEVSSLTYGLAGFSRAQYDQLAATVDRIAAAAPGDCEAAGWNGQSTTTVGNLGSLGADFFTGYLFWDPGSPLDAGPTITMSGNGGSLRFDSATPGFYLNYSINPSQSSSQGSLIGPGTYQLSNGSGGTDIPGFQTTIAIPDRLRFTTATPTSITRSSDSTITWSGGSQDDRVLVYGASWDQYGQVGGGFTCVQRGSAGRLTIPSAILSVLPKSGTVQTGQGGGMLMLYSLSPFQRSSISGLDAFYAATLNLAYRLVQFQ